MIKFDEKSHTYTYAGNDPKYKGKKFVSTTQFIGWFKNPYDSQYWSLYKAIKDHYSNVSEAKWIGIKRAAGGWQKVVDYYKKNINSVSIPARLAIEVIQNDYLRDWDIKRRVSTDRGSVLHKNLEDDVIGAKEFVGDKGKVHSVDVQKFFYHEVNKVSISSFPECIIYNLEFMLSGMVDRVDKDGIFLDIYDYKSNIEIEKKAFMDQTMKVLGLPDCNYYHYQLQMSIYGWMLEKFGYKVRSLNLEHLITPNRYSKEVTDIIPYDIEYRPDLVEKMLEYRFRKTSIK